MASAIRIYAQAVGNIVLGSVAVITNIALICAFLSNKRRRRTYPLLLTLAFGDLLSALAFVGYGANRLHKQLANNTEPNSPAFCLGTVYPIVTPLSQILIAFVTLFIAVDRFLGMRLPFFYYLRIKPVKYYPYLGLIVLVATVFASVGVYQYATRLKTMPWDCGTPYAVDDVYNNVRFGVAGFGGLLAAAIYCVALIPTGYQLRGYSEMNVNGEAKLAKDTAPHELPLSFLRRQSRITKEISFLMLSTLLLYAVPMFQYWLLFGLKLRSPILFAVAPYAGWLTVVHSTLNVMLLCFLSQDIRTILVKTVLPAHCWKTKSFANVSAPSSK